MHFEHSLKRSIYQPWKDQYINYNKLKLLLRDNNSDDADTWTDEDESKFVEELVNVQLEKVANFQSSTVQNLKDRAAECEAKLEPVSTKSREQNAGDEEPTQLELDEGEKNMLKEVLKELDGITEQMNELEKYSRINYTGFLKATKKHDRRRGAHYRVRPLMQVRLADLPFNKEDYSPLLFRLSTMYSFARQQLEGGKGGRAFSESQTGVEKGFTSHRFWVHPENLLELKTVILRRLPVLVYNPQSSKVADGQLKDPTVTSIYFDNPEFSLYNAKVGHVSDATSLRVRWYDQLNNASEVFIEKKTVHPDDTSDELKFVTKPKYIQGFLAGDYKLDKDVQKLKDRVGEDSEEVRKFQASISEVQSYIKENNLQSVIRANYQRTAFQIPGDDRVRITLDTNLALIREDCLDPERPCRDPDTWHRRDIDDGEMDFPFSSIRKGEINRFPYALLEIRIRGNKKYEWVSEVMSSHLVKQVPRFSKFVQGVAQLFDDHVNTFPFWVGEVDTDIRRDPHEAFEAEQNRKAKTAEAEFAVGSMLSSVRRASAANFKPSTVSPAGSLQTSKAGKTPVDTSTKNKDSKAIADLTRRASSKPTQQDVTIAEEDDDEDQAPDNDGHTGFRSFLPHLPMSKYAGRHRHGQVKLPPGVSEPAYWIKDEGPVKVEAKVYLANQRTYIKWQHVSILLASLSVALYNAAGEHNNIARALAVVYTIVALFTALWGYGLYWWRSRLIAARSGKDFDNAIGPVVVCVSLIVALCVNFGFKWDQAMKGKNGAGRPRHGHRGNDTADDELLQMMAGAGQSVMKNATEVVMAAWEEL